MNTKEVQKFKEMMPFWHTVADTDAQLREWQTYLANQDYFELGQNSIFVQEIEKDFQTISKQIRYLKNYFDLSKVSLDDANKYYELLLRLDVTLEFLQTVRQQAFGSTVTTQKFLEQISACVESVFNMSQVFPIASIVIQQ